MADYQCMSITVFLYLNTVIELISIVWRESAKRIVFVCSSRYFTLARGSQISAAIDRSSIGS